MSGGTTLDADETSTLSGALTQSGNITIDVLTDKTLTYSGASLNLGANILTLSGGGTLSNTNALVLNNADSLLSLSGITTMGDINGTAASNQNKGVSVTSSATMGDYDLSGVSYLSIGGAGVTLAGQLNLNPGGEMITSGETTAVGSTTARKRNPKARNLSAQAWRWETPGSGMPIPLTSRISSGFQLLISSSLPMMGTSRTCPFSFLPSPVTPKILTPSRLRLEITTDACPPSPTTTTGRDSQPVISFIVPFC